MGGSFSVIHGRLANDPEQRTYKKSDGSTGTMVVFCVAVDSRFGDHTNYWDCAAHGKTGELVMAHLKKGKEVVCYGEHVYNEKDKKRYWTLNIDKFEFCGTKDQTAPDDSMEQVNKDVPF